jgi:hypothetical protein
VQFDAKNHIHVTLTYSSSVAQSSSLQTKEDSVTWGVLCACVYWLGWQCGAKMNDVAQGYSLGGFFISSFLIK